MGCQCISKEYENQFQILKKENESDNNEYPEDTDKSSIKKNEMETPYNEEQNITNKNINYLSYTEKMLEIINNIRKDPVSYADIIEDSMQNIIEEPDKNDESKTKKIYKYKIKVALNRGEAAFEEAGRLLML